VDPRTPSVVSRTCKPKPAGQDSLKPGLECVSLRTVSPSLHSCPASDGASSFLQASALDSHEALRLPGSEDARCVRSTSATQTICVHPHLMELPARSHGFHRGEVPRTLRLRVTQPGIRTFHDARDRFGGPASNENLVFQVFAWRRERGRFLPTTLGAIEPLTSLSPLPLPSSVIPPSQD
jgi:hypothetical protein